MIEGAREDDVIHIMLFRKEKVKLAYLIRKNASSVISTSVFPFKFPSIMDPSDAATGDEVAASSIWFESKMILRMCCLNLELA
jgi:hypothetical protein